MTARLLSFDTSRLVARENVETKQTAAVIVFGNRTTMLRSLREHTSPPVRRDWLLLIESKSSQS